MSTLIVNAGSTLVRGAGAMLSSGALRRTAIGAARSLATRAINHALDDRSLEGPRLAGLHLQSSTEGAQIPLVWGRVRLAGQMIWAARFSEHRTEHESGGGKGGGPTTTEYSYSLSFAIGLCEGEIIGIGRAWANGSPLNLSDFTYRLYRGGEDQAPDSLIEAIEGAVNAPAYRGLAYIVFEDMPLAQFGERPPQLSFEVLRRPKHFGDDAPLDQMIRAVDMIPASGEFTYATQTVFKEQAPGVAVPENARNAQGRTDFLVALDNLQAEAPNCDFVWLTIGWFGDDLRCGVCEIRPGVEASFKNTTPYDWSVGGVARDGAHLISQNEFGAIYGGTPSDFGIIQAIQELRARGFQVGLYPFLFMDIAPGNAKPDPYGAAEQSAFPWRGRITCHPAPGQSGSPDNSNAAIAQVDAFFGSASAAHFSVSPVSVAYSGPDEWRFNRFILHQAALGVAAGGVDAFLIGSEMRGLTRVRSARNVYPTISKLRHLAGQTRVLLGGGTKILYAADWSEYGAHVPGDGSGDVGFPLDALFAESNIDAVGLDWYAPLTDWRDDGPNADAAEAQSIYDAAYLEACIEGGADFDYFYASDADRIAQIRTPITDGAYNKPWIYRTKDVRAWWSNEHYERLGGVEAGSPTAWVPQSKPIWLTELGCPAADKGANQPNVFYDPKSAESALPHFSNGQRDDLIQRRVLEAYLRYWAPEAGRNPISSAYGDHMIDSSRTAIWCWDGRPYPDFPGRIDVWGDHANWKLGHWITGRLGLAPLADVVAEIGRRAGLEAIDVSALDGIVAGFTIADPSSARQALSLLASAYSFDLAPSGAGLVARRRNGAAVANLTLDDLALANETAPRFERTRHDPCLAPVEARVRYYDPTRDYAVGSVSARRKDGAQDGVIGLDLPLMFDAEQAEAIAWRALAEARAERDQVECALPQRLLHLTPGDVVNLDFGDGVAAFQLDSIVEGRVRRARLTRTADAPGLSPSGPVVSAGAEQPIFTPPDFLLIDAPFASDAQGWQMLAALHADPWPGAMRIYAGASSDSLRLVGRADAPAGIGELTSPLAPGFCGRWQENAKLHVRLRNAFVQSQPSRNVLNGANMIAVQTSTGWEFIQYRDALLAGPDEWILSGLLRGQFGTDDQMLNEIEEGARVVVVDDRLVSLQLSESERGLTLQFRAGPAGRDKHDASYANQETQVAARALKPWSVCHVRARKLPGGDVLISWTRRARWGGDGWDGEPPLNEEGEAYEIAVLDGGVLKRRLQTSAASVVYSLGDQIADFGMGVSSLSLALAQVSARAGPGIGRQFVLAV